MKPGARRLRARQGRSDPSPSSSRPRHDSIPCSTTRSMNWLYAASAPRSESSRTWSAMARRAARACSTACRAASMPRWRSAAEHGTKHPVTRIRQPHDDGLGDARDRRRRCTAAMVVNGDLKLGRRTHAGRLTQRHLDVRRRQHTWRKSASGPPEHQRQSA